MLRIACAVLTLLILTALAAYAWRGWYTRYITDDFCTAATLNRLGVVDAMRFHRETWSGRYSYYATKAVPESIGPGTARFAPGAVILLFVAAGVWAFRQIELAHPGSGRFALLAGCTLVFATIDATPEVLAVGGPLVWETGVVTYMLPLVLYTIWLGIYLGRGSVRARALAGAAVLLVAGGFSETSLAAQGAFTAVLLAVAVLRRERGARTIAAAGLGATIVSLLIMTSAPGNAVRMSELPPQQPFLSAVVATLQLAYSYVGSNVFIGGAALLSVLLVGVLIGRGRGAESTAKLSLFAAASLSAFVATMIPAAWMLGTSPPPRALHVSNYFFILAILGISAAVTAARPALARYALPLLLILSGAAAIASTATTVRSLEEGRRGAAEMDRIARVLEAQPGRDVVIHSPWALSSRILVTDPAFWTNRCIAEFYGVRSVSVTR